MKELIKVLNGVTVDKFSLVNHSSQPSEEEVFLFELIGSICMDFPFEWELLLLLPPFTPD